MIEGLPNNIYDDNYLGTYDDSTYTNTKDDYLLDDFRVYDKILTETEISYLANNMIQIQEQPVYRVQENIYTVLEDDSTNLVAWYKFDDDTNKGLNSSVSPNSIGDAGYHETPTLDSSEYVIGKSSYFSGNGDHSFVLDDNSDNLYYAIYQKPITITFWCKSIGLGQGGYGRIFYGAPTGSGNNVNSFQILHWDGQRGKVTN